MEGKDENARVPIRQYVDVRITAVEKALDGLEGRTVDKFETSNKAREEIAENTRNFYSKEAHEIYSTAIELRIRALESWHDRVLGQNALLISIFGIAILAAELAFHFLWH